jgi:hypothetical protein
MGLVALGEGGSRIQTNYDEGVEGNPLIIVFLVAFSTLPLSKKGIINHPYPALWNSNLPLDKAFVKISTSCSSVRMYCNNIILLCTQSHRW